MLRTRPRGTTADGPLRLLRHITGIATKQNDLPGVLGPNLILDGSRSGGEAPSLPELFQSASRSLGLGRTAARAWCKHSDIRLCFIPVAAALSRTLSDSYCRVIGAIRQ